MPDPLRPGRYGGADGTLVGEPCRPPGDNLSTILYHVAPRVLGRSDRTASFRTPITVDEKYDSLSQNEES